MNNISWTGVSETRKNENHGTTRAENDLVDVMVYSNAQDRLPKTAWNSVSRRVILLPPVDAFQAVFGYAKAICSIPDNKAGRC